MLSKNLILQEKNSFSNYLDESKNARRARLTLKDKSNLNTAIKSTIRLSKFSLKNVFKTKW